MQVIHVNLTSEAPVPIQVGGDLSFSYSVRWEESGVPFEKRFERYLDFNFFEHQIHWFSLFNSFMMVIFLVGLVSMILMRTLRRDYAKYAQADDDLEALEMDLQDESGWKMVHGDVFRPVRYLSLFCALIGTGAQLAVLVLAVILIACFSTMYSGRGLMLTAVIICYTFTSCIGGYVSGGMYARNDGKNWIRTMAFTGVLFPGTCFTIAMVLSTIAIGYHSLAAVPFGTIVKVFLLFVFITLPLTLFGTVLGRNWAGVAKNPCRIKRIPSAIPANPWYLSPAAIVVLGGVLPFGSIFIEMYFIFTSFWNYKVYYVYGIMLLVYIILVIVTLCVSTVGAYFLLNAENYQWKWTSYLSGSSTAAYVFLYSIHYFFNKTKMTGFFQTCFYFGYTSMFCTGLGILCGAMGYMGASMFVHRVYHNIKLD